MTCAQPGPRHFGKTAVFNRRVACCDLSIARPSKWGNPFRIGPDGTREEVIEKYRKWIQTQPHLMAALSELTGKALGCWCKPLPCHGDVLVELAEAARDEEGRR